MTRLSCMMRFHTREETSILCKVVRSLSEWNILERELNLDGVNGKKSILLYYLPALLVNILAATKKEEVEVQRKALTVGLQTVAKLFSTSREHLLNGKEEESGVFTVDISEVANKAKIPLELNNYHFVLNRIGNDGKIACLFKS